MHANVHKAIFVSGMYAFGMSNQKIGCILLARVYPVHTVKVPAVSQTLQIPCYSEVLECLDR